MKACRPLGCLFGALLCCAMLCLASAADDDLLDFDFSDLKEIDWDYNSGSSSSSSSSSKNNNKKTAAAAVDKKLRNNLVTFDDDFDMENQVHPFDWRERILRTALSKALTNGGLRQKFVEVMPILRVLSSQQRLALSALISAQVNARKGQELKLEQVRMMFGDDKKLLIPIVYDIANLVRNSARKFLQFDYDIVPSSELKEYETPMHRRTYELSAAEASAEKNNVSPPSSLPPFDASDISLEDFLVEIPKNVLDAKSINEELQSIKRKTPARLKPFKSAKITTTTKIKTTTSPPATTTSTNTKSSIIPKKTEKLQATKRRRRSAIAAQTEFVHKLIRSIPLSVNEDDLMKGAAGRTMRLNTTAFYVPHEGEKQTTKRETPTTTATTSTVTVTTPTAAISSTQIYQQHTNQQQEQQWKRNSDQISAQQSNQGDQQQTEPLQQTYQEIEDLAFAGLNSSEIILSSTTANTTGSEEPLPNPEELIAGPRYRLGGSATNRLRTTQLKVPSKRKRIQVRARPKSPLGQSSVHAPVVVPKKCERFTASMCLRTDDYPLELIMGSIRRHKNAMTALLAEYHDKNSDFDHKDDFDDYAYNKKRREDDEIDGKGGMCQSIVRFARPQKARSASGEWKYIVNTGQHTQTLRLEKCSNPQESCSYLAHNYRSHCAQVYNYHRLLSWDKTRGLHVDIFKVPTCCSCQIDGYRQQFPPLESIKAKGYSPADHYSTIGEELDYEDDDDDDTLGYGHNYGSAYNKHQKYSQSSPYDHSELLLGSKKVRTKIYAPKPTVGSYLSPPSTEDLGLEYSYKRQRAATSGIHSPSSTSLGTSSSSSLYGSTSNNLLHQYGSRRPYKSLQNGDRVDLEIAPSEYHTEKEVNFLGRTSDTTRVHPKRKRIYSVPHTATSTSAVASSASGSRSQSGSSKSTSTAAAAASAAVGVGVVAGAAAAAVPPYYVSNTAAIASSAAPTYVSSTPVKTTSAPSSATAPYYTSSAIPPSYHINSIYSTKYSAGDSSSAGGGGGVMGSSTIGGGTPKRINYSYHPIIDFFENNKRSAAAVAAALTSTPASNELTYHQPQPNPNSTPQNMNVPVGAHYQSRNRIGFGAGAGADINSWQPVVMES